MSDSVLTAQWLELVESMQDLVQQTTQVTPRYFYMELLRRSGRRSLVLRWRSTGRRGTSFRFDDLRLQLVLQTLPVALRRQYTRWELEKEELNRRASHLRRVLSDQLSEQAFQQLVLEV